MLDAFWSGVGEELARTWVARVLTPAFAFWAAGTALVWWRLNGDAVRDTGWTAAVTASADAIGALPVVVQVGVIVGGLLVVAASAVIAERLTQPLLRVLEGYWPAWLCAPLIAYRRWLLGRARRRHDDLFGQQRRRGLSRADYGELLRLRSGPLDSAARRRVDELESTTHALSPVRSVRLSRAAARLATTPGAAEDVMPTRLGDVLRAAERRPLSSYGIDGVACWAALWLTMPAETRVAVAEARTALDAAARSWLWGALFLLWTPVNPWAVAIGVGVPLLAYRFGILPRATTFGAMLVTAYDLHRITLYDALHLPRPATPYDELTVAGPRVTDALAGLLAGSVPYRFDPSPKPADDAPEAVRPPRRGLRLPARRRGPRP